MCLGYHGSRLDQKTMTRVIRAYGHLQLWMDAMEVFADYVEEAGLVRPPGRAGIDIGRNNTIDMVIEVVMDVLSKFNQVSRRLCASSTSAASLTSHTLRYAQEHLVPTVLERLVEKGIPISKGLLQEAFQVTSTDHVTSTLHTHKSGYGAAFCICVYIY